MKPNDDEDLPVLSRYCYLLSADCGSLRKARQLNHPFDDGKYTHVVGSCNGLLALFDGDEEISLWNPSTGKSQILPLPETEFPPEAYRSKFYACGFGYDPTSDDYKLVRVVQSDSIDSEVKVYSLKTNSWRRIKDYPFYLKFQITGGVLVNNALHWIVSKFPETEYQTFGEECGFVVALDLETEEYRIIESPDRIGNYFHIHIRAMDGCLCLIPSIWPSLDGDIWMMKEYGVKESWIKLISLSVYIVDFKCALPVAFSKNRGKVLLYIDDKKLAWYDLRSKRLANVRIEGVPSGFLVDMSVDSLVPLNGNDAIINKEKKQPSEKRQKQQRKKNTKRDDFLSKGFHLVL